MIKDMTQGSVIKHLIIYALPMLLGNIFQQLYSAVDTWAVGRGVGVDALAAVGSTGSIHFLILGFVTGFTYGFSILIAQSFGKKDEVGLRRVIANSVYLSAIVTIVISVISVVFARPLLELMNTPENLINDAWLYIVIIFAGMFTTVFYNMAASVLRALGDSVSPLIIVIISSLINVGLDVLFVIVLKWGVAGAAYATLIAQLLSGFMCMFVIGRIPMLRMSREDWNPRKELLFELTKLGLPVGLMNSVTAVGMVVLQWIVNGFGAVTVAAYTVCSKLIGFAEQPGHIIGLSVGTFAGQNLGANNISRVREGVRKALVLSTLINIGVGAILIAFGRQITTFFVSGDAGEVIDTAYPFLVLIGIMIVVLGYLFIYRFALQGIGDTFIPLVSGGVELALRVAVVFIIPVVMGFWRISIAEVSAWTGATILLGITYYIRMHKLKRNSDK